MVEKYESGYYNEVLPPNSGGSVTDTITVTTTAQEIKSGSSRLSNRRGVYLQNQSTLTMLWGFDSTDCLMKLAPDTDTDGNGGTIWIDVGDNQPIYIKVASGSGTLAFCEIK